MLNNKNNIVTIVVVVLIVVGGIFLVNKKGSDSAYSVVYVTTGEVYIGKLTTFPDFELKDAYIFQAVQDPNDPEKSNLNLTPIKEAFWAPQSLHFIKDNVIFYGPLMSDSEIAKTLAEQEK